ncbi:MOFRL family protein, partial [Propylenella binzhouense]
ADIARAAGFDARLLGDALEGEAREVAAEHARLALTLAAGGARSVLISGGELTVTIRGTGRGGPNQEYALAFAAAIDGADRICGLAADTDGTDGGGGNSSDPAGALFDGNTAQAARARGLEPANFLANNDATGFFESVGGLVSTGPTGTNVNDFRCIVVDNAEGPGR